MLRGIWVSKVPETMLRSVPWSSADRRSKTHTAQKRRRPHLDLEGGQVGEVGAVAMEAQGLAEADEEAGQGPGEAGVVVAADEDEEEHEGLDDGESRAW